MGYNFLVGIMSAVVTLFFVCSLLCFHPACHAKARKLFIACNAAVACTWAVASILFFLNLMLYARIFLAVSVIGMLLVEIFFRPRPLLSIPDGKAKAAPGFELAEGDGGCMTLGEAEAYWKAQGCEIARLKHYYAMAGNLTPKQLESIRKDCRRSWIVSDRLDYQGRMVSVSGREYVECPEYRNVPLAEVLGTLVGLNLVQALCGTKDGADAIMRKLEKLFGMKPGFIRLRTSDMDWRKAYPSRATGFIYEGGGLYVDGDFSLLDYSGRSHGVRVR